MNDFLAVRAVCISRVRSCVKDLQDHRNRIINFFNAGLSGGLTPQDAIHKIEFQRAQCVSQQLWSTLPQSIGKRGSWTRSLV